MGMHFSLIKLGRTLGFWSSSLERGVCMLRQGEEKVNEVYTDIFQKARNLRARGV